MPNCVYQARVIALNEAGVASEPSPVTQFVTPEPHTYVHPAPSNALKMFLVQCGDDYVLGDTILFTEDVFETHPRVGRLHAFDLGDSR